MKLTDMVMVIDNTKGTEHNMLLTKQEYKQDYIHVMSLGREETAEAVRKLHESGKTGGWAEFYVTANKSLYARMCRNDAELTGFLQGEFNSGSNWSFSEENSSKECIRLLDDYNIAMDGSRKGITYHYEKISPVFFTGDVLHNFNGKDYRILECYTKTNLLMLDLRTSHFMVGIGVEKFVRYPKNAEKTSENAEYGVEWGQGIYLDGVPSQIDFAELRREYGLPPSPNKDGEYGIEIRETLSRVENIKADCLGDAIDEAMERYRSEQVVLDSEDYKETEYIPVEIR